MGEVVEGFGIGVGGGVQLGGDGFGEFGQAGSQEPVLGAEQEQGVFESVVGDVVAAGVGTPGDEPVFTQAPEVVTGLGRGDGVVAQLGHGVAELGGGEPVDGVPGGEEGLEQVVDPGVGEAEPGSAGAGVGVDDGGGDAGEDAGSFGGVVAD